ncbi:Protein kinase superfamily protein [Perilla frutescens var. hirtella]|nr:Protein kinase superfamily protein [Perilla frutescens var. hirtella]
MCPLAFPITIGRLLIRNHLQDLSCSKEYVSQRVGGIHSKSETKWSNGAKQQSYPLPLPPGALPNSSPVSPAAKSPSTPSRSPERAENAKSPGTSWKKGKLIGRGLLGNVYLGFNSEKGEMCAMKEARLSSDVDMKRGARMLEKEISLLSHIKHPNIVQYLGSQMVDDNFYICFEYVSGGSIHTILREYGKLEESAIRNYTQQILAGLVYLHSKNIVHGNIKAASILVDPNGGVKLSSFVIEKHVRFLCVVRKSNQSFLVHSSYWIAPEAVKNSNVSNPASDIWSLGCTVLEMATSKPPLSQYKEVMAMFKVAYHKELPMIPVHLSDVCKDFLRYCLQWNPLHRPTAFQLLEHPFVKGLSPSGERILVSASLDHSSVANSVKPEGRNPHELDSGKVVSFFMCDVYTPKEYIGGESSSTAAQ